MDGSKRITQFVDDVVAGLKGDPELMLEARAELLTHIEETVESLRSAGKSEDESVTMALKTFGPATDTAGDLVRANAGRMRLRAVARLVVRAAVVPVACVVALVVVLGMLQRDARLLLYGIEGGFGVFHTPPFDSLTDKERFVVYGDEMRPSWSGRHRALWEKWPDSSLYFANYMSALYYEVDREGGVERFAKEMRHAESVDPDNGVYPLLMADLLIKRSCHVEKDRDGSTSGSGANGERVPDYRLKIWDQATLERAMDNLAAAIGKPFIDDYSDERQRGLLALLPPARGLEDIVAEQAMMSASFSFALGAMQELGQVAALHGERLAGDGRSPEGELFLNAWRELGIRYMRGDQTPDLMGYAGCYLSAGGEVSAQALERLGRPDEAAEARTVAARLREPYDVRQSRRGSISASYGYLKPLPTPETWRSEPALGHLLWARTDLAPGRAQEYLLAEQVALTVLVLVLAILLVDAGVVGLRWRAARGASSAPILLVPSWAHMFQILLVAVLCPVALYFGISRLTPWAGRDEAFRFAISSFSIFALLLGVVIVVGAYGMANSHIRRRCTALRIPMPPRQRPRLRAAVTTVAVVSFLMLTGMAVAEVAGEGGVKWPPLYACAIVGAFAAAIQARVVAHCLGARKEHGLYYGTVARSLMPIFAGAIIILGGVVQPSLRAREAHLFKSDPAMRLDPTLPALFEAETELGEHMKEDLLAVLGK